jgi:hypothetical protein
LKVAFIEEAIAAIAMLGAGIAGAAAQQVVLKVHHFWPPA